MGIEKYVRGSKRGEYENIKKYEEKTREEMMRKQEQGRRTMRFKNCSAHSLTNHPYVLYENKGWRDITSYLRLKDSLPKKSEKK